MHLNFCRLFSLLKILRDVILYIQNLKLYKKHILPGPPLNNGQKHLFCQNISKKVIWEVIVCENLL